MKHKCIIADYFHSSSEIYSANHCSQIDGIGDIACFHNFCSICGKKITDEMITKFWKLKKGNK